METFTSGGPGGQHQNRTESGVRLVHLPTGITVSCREERSQYRNKVRALARLRERLEEFFHQPHPRRPTSVPAAEKRKRLEDKRRRSRIKRLRRPPSEGEDGG